jgi:dipeptidyl aminopeptidase/acylaminoacyl peptidase
VKALLALLALWLALNPAWADGYRQPSTAVQAALDARLPLRVQASPDSRWLALVEPRRYVPLAELARPLQRLAGARFEANNRSGLPSQALQSLALRATDARAGSERAVTLPAGGTWHGFQFSPDGRFYVLQRRTEWSTELWVGRSAGGEPQPVPGLRLNNVLSDGDLVWWNAQELLVLAVPANAGTPPREPLPGPESQEHSGRGSPEPPHTGLLRNDYDSALFEHLARSQVVRVNLPSASFQRLGEPGLFASLTVLGEGQALLTERLARPFPRLLTWDDFPQVVELRNAQGRVLREIAKLPARLGVPVDGTLPGPRVFYGAPTRDASLYWVEALDGGNPQAKVAYRDRVMRLAAPYTGEAEEIQRMPHRFARLRFLEDGAHALLTEIDRARAWTRTYLLPLNGLQSRTLVEYSVRERARHPGLPLMRTAPSGQRVVHTGADGSFWFVGAGHTAKGERPFLDRYQVKDVPVQRVFQADNQLELPLQWLDGKRLLTQIERPLDARQWGVREGAQWTALTAAPEPPAPVRALRREFVTFKRDDGVDMSFWVVLPPDWQEGQKRPALVWTYPLEYADGQLASQQAAPSDRNQWPPPGSPAWLALDGYVVIYDATMPIVGDTKTVNDTFLEQIQRNARAIVDKADELGSVDVRRLAIGGQSYGAFTAVNLLAHTNLFKAGIARSGAYNRTLTPFGFQSERRNLWEAREAYLRLSPLLFANQIREPLLLLHGEQDPNSGTPVLQSERLYHALAGLGQPVRLTVLPLEGHTLVSREAAGQVQWEMSNWLRRHLGDPRGR